MCFALYAFCGSHSLPFSFFAMLSLVSLLLYKNFRFCESHCVIWFYATVKISSMSMLGSGSLTRNLESGHLFTFLAACSTVQSVQHSWLILFCFVFYHSSPSCKAGLVVLLNNKCSYLLVVM